MLYPRDFLQLSIVLRRAYAHSMQAICEQYKLSHIEVDVMLFLYSNPRYDTARDIVSQCGIAKSHVSQTVEKLARRGYLAVFADTQDRRKNHLQLEKSAIPAVQEAKQAQEKFFSSLLRGISTEQLALLEPVYRNILRNLQQELL